MSIREKAINRLEQFGVGKRLLHEQRYRIFCTASISFFLNLLYAFYNGMLGIMKQSIWFVTMCAYYIILGVMRFCAILCEHKGGPRSAADIEFFVYRLAGAMFVLLSLLLTGIIYISLAQNIAVKRETVTMITIATYTFSKITLAVMRAVKQRNESSPLLAAIRRIGYVEVAVSVLTLQRSMLVSFGPESSEKARTMNIWAGAAVCLFVFVLGCTMIGSNIRKRRF